MNIDPRYQPVEAALPDPLPAISRAEAARAVAKIFARFGGLEHGSPDMKRPARNRYGAGRREGVRTCWISPKPTRASDHLKGWGRLIHDVSHDLFAQRCPRLPPHHNSHARLEAEIAAYAVAQGWLSGKLAPKPKAAPSPAQKRADQLAGIDDKLARWRTKAKRAANAIRKLERQRKAQQRAIAKAQAAIAEGEAV